MCAYPSAKVGGLGKEARLCFMGHALMENRNGLIIGAVATAASGHAARLAALALVGSHAEVPQPVTLAADKGYDRADFVRELRDRAVTPHVATPAAAARRLMAAPSAIPAMRSRSASANASRKLSAAPRRWPACVRCGIADCSKSIGNSPSRWPPMTSSACPNCLPRLFNEAAHISNRVLLFRPRPVPPITKPVHHCNADHPEARTRQNRYFFSTLLVVRRAMTASHGGMTLWVARPDEKTGYRRQSMQSAWSPRKEQRLSR